MSDISFALVVGCSFVTGMVFATLIFIVCPPSHVRVASKAYGREIAVIVSKLLIRAKNGNVEEAQDLLEKMIEEVDKLENKKNL